MGELYLAWRVKRKERRILLPVIFSFIHSLHHFIERTVPASQSQVTLHSMYGHEMLQYM